ncbi:MAG: hypothetical protein ACI8RD_013212 [Bacillariaceae sp.]|jgi:hypothetical protein
MRSSSRLRLALSSSSKSLYRILQTKHNSVGRCLSTTTYYDSQSGLHLPIHNQQEIRLFLDVNNSSDTSTNIPFVIPHQLNKHRDEADEMSDKLKQLTGMGIHGVILPPFKFPRDYRNFQTLVSIAPPNFYFLCSTDDDGGAILKARDYSSSTNLSKVFQYDNNDENTSLRNSIGNGLHTTLSITKDIYAGDINGGDNVVEPITLANNIASMIDAVGGCDFIWLSSKTSIKNDETTVISETTTPSSSSTTALVADNMIQICEELIYLDVAGATIKSRLLVDSLNEDIVEDTMFAGVNSYVIDNEEQVDMIENVAKEQGKSIFQS